MAIDQILNIDDDKKPPSYWRIAIPMAIIFTLLLITLNIVLTAQGQLALRELCLEANLGTGCNDPTVLQEGASYASLAIGLPAFLCVLTVGFWAAISNKIGRKWLLFVAILGQFMTIFAWFIVYCFPSLLSGWKGITIMGGILSACCGGVLILYLAVFGSMNDLSSRHPSLRLYYYLGFDLLGAICGVIGTQLASYYMSKDPINLTTICVVLYGLTATFVLLLPETIDPILQAQSIIWKQVNLFKQIQFALPNNKESQLILQKDFNKIYSKIATIYKEQNPNWIRPIDSYQDGHGNDTNDHDSTYIETNDDDNNNNNKSTNNTDNSIDNNNDDDFIPPNQDPFINTDFTSTSSNYSNTIELQSTSSKQNQKLSTSTLERVPTRLDSNLLQNQVHPQQDQHNNNDDLRTQQHNNNINNSNLLPPLEIPQIILQSPPRYIKHRNATLILLISLALNTLVYLGHKIVDLLFMKQIYNVTPKQFSNLLSYQVVARSLCSLVMFPLFKKYVTTSRGEINILLIASIIQGILYCFYPFMPHFWQYCTLNVVNFVISILPAAIVRSLLSNTISEELQRYILSALVSVEVFVVLFGGVSANLLWIATSKTFPGTVYILFCAVLSILAGIVIPLGLTDSNDDFNLRIQMTTQYTKIEHLEIQYQYELKLLQNDEQYQHDSNDGNNNHNGQDIGNYDRNSNNNTDPINSDGLHHNNYEPVQDDETDINALQTTSISLKA